MDPNHGDIVEGNPQRGATTLWSLHRLLLIMAAIAIGVVATIGVTVLRERLERGRQAQTVIAEVRLETTAVAAIEMMSASSPTVRAAMSDQRQETLTSLDHDLARLATLMDDTAAVEAARVASKDFVAEVDRSAGDVTRLKQPFGSLPYLAWFRLDAALNHLNERADAAATSTGRDAVIGTWIIMGLSGALIALLSGRVASERARSRHLAHKAATDSLTGLSNHGAFAVRLNAEIDSARAADQPLSLVLIDVDHFKAINDTFGHQVGDAVLVEVAGRLRRAVRSQDVIGRLGGDELAWLLPRTDVAEAQAAAVHVLSALQDEPFAGAGHLTASLGVAGLAPDGDAQALIRDADAALYSAKRDGRAQVVVAGVPRAGAPLAV